MAQKGERFKARQDLYLEHSLSGESFRFSDRSQHKRSVFYAGDKQVALASHR